MEIWRSRRVSRMESPWRSIQFRGIEGHASLLYRTAAIPRSRRAQDLESDGGLSERLFLLECRALRDCGVVLPERGRRLPQLRGGLGQPGLFAPHAILRRPKG